MIGEDVSVARCLDGMLLPLLVTQVEYEGREREEQNDSQCTDGSEHVVANCEVVQRIVLGGVNCHICGRPSLSEEEK